MNAVFASTYLCPPQFPSTVSYSFPSVDLLPHWLNLFLGTFVVVVAIVNRIFFFTYSFLVFIVGVQKCHQFLKIDFVSCYFAEIAL